MVPTASVPIPFSSRTPKLEKSATAPRSASSQARRRRALLQLARRYGEVRLRVAVGGRPVAGAAEVSELLDMLNEDGLLRYGGLHAVSGAREIVYLAA